MASHDTHSDAGAEGSERGFVDKSYLVEIGKGLANTFMHLITGMSGQTATVQYPEKTIYDEDEAHRAIGEVNPRSRGEHILVKDDQGREKCVACLLCMAACPAVCSTSSRRRRRRSGRTGIGGPRPSRSTCCGASTAATARRPVRVTRSA